MGLNPTVLFLLKSTADVLLCYLVDHHGWCMSEAGQYKGGGGEGRAFRKHKREQSRWGFWSSAPSKHRLLSPLGFWRQRPQSYIDGKKGKNCELLLDFLTQVTEPTLYSAGRVLNGSKKSWLVEMFCLKITEPQNALGWKGPLQLIWSNLPARRKDIFTLMRRKSLSHGPSKSKVIFQLERCHHPTSSSNIVTGLKLWQQIKRKSPGKH